MYKLLPINLTFFIMLFCIFMKCDSSKKGDVTLPKGPTLLIRCDDIGMCHAVNMALTKLIDTGIPFSASVMFACPWYQEAVDILRAHPEISVGVHLTLNAEWKNYRWGPVCGAQTVPSLVDSCGYFFPSRQLFFENNPHIDDVERELRAQIQRALQSGLKIDYVDYHMSTAVSTPEYRSLLLKLTAEYRLGISRCFGELDAENIYAVPVDAKKDSLITIMAELDTGHTYLAVFHIGQETPEMDALLDLNPFGLPHMSQHRNAELNALCSPEFKHLLTSKNFNLLMYRDLIKEKGLAHMKFAE